MATNLHTMIDIRAAEIPADLPAVQRLFREYERNIDADLCFQGFEAELASLPGKYAQPGGRLLLAWRGDEAVGCVALRPVAGDTGEMKRLYVQPGMRGQQLGRSLVERICHEGRGAGYRRIWLDTMPGMAAAIRLYADLGFKPIAPYGSNSTVDLIFLGRDL